MRIDASGNVGIGATSIDDGNLQIGDANSAFNISIAGPRTKFGYDGANTVVQGGIAKGIVFCVNNSTLGSGEAVRISSAGNVGIGTTSPAVALDIAGSSTTQMRIQMSGQADTRVLSDTGTGIVGTYSNHPLTIKTNSSTAATIDTSGNVGIGTSSPAAKLHIKDTSNPANTTGSVIIEGQRDGTANLMELRARDNGTPSGALPNGQGGIIRMSGFDGTDFEELAFIGYQADGAAVADGDAPGRLIFGTTPDGGGAATEKMRIDASGNVLVGKTAADNETQGVRIYPTGRQSIVSEADTALIINRRSSVGTVVSLRKDATQVGSISVTGSATAYNTSSDARLKDVTGEARGLEVINELNPVAYNWKADGKADEGLIAQEVLDIVPNAVSGSEEDMYQMDYSKLVTPLIKAVQEQQELITTLQAEVALLKEK